MRRRSNLAWLSVSAALLAACVVGCSDSTEPLVGDAATDGPAPDATTHPGADAGTDTGAADVKKASDSGLHDGAIADGGELDATTDRTTDAATDSATDATTDSTTDATTDSTTDATADSTTLDAHADASDSGPPEPLALCTLFDSRFFLNEADATVAAAESDRVNASNSWAFDIYNNFFNQTGALIGGDCSFSGFTLAVETVDNSNMTAAYNGFLNYWIQQFMGCPIIEDAGALSYGLLPPELPGHVYTTADLNELSSVFIDGINNTLACAGDCINGPGTLPDGGPLANVAPLTSDQIASIRAELAYLQSQVRTTLVDSGSLSFTADPSCDPSTSCFALCPVPDAGASDASGD